MTISGCLHSICNRAGSPRLSNWAFIAAVLLLVAVPAGSARADDPVSFSVDTKGSYTLGPGDSESLARRLAWFRAKRLAAGQAAERFERRRLIQFMDRDKNELVALVADSLNATERKDRCRPDGRSGSTTCIVRARVVVRLSDFIDAQLVSLELSRIEDRENYHDELEPQIQDPFEPGQALAKAYRLIDKHEPRMAVIFLDSLTRRFPNWWEAYEIKAMALRLQNQVAAMKQAYLRACELGRLTACSKLD